MRLGTRIAATVAALAMAGTAVAGCAPSTSVAGGGPQKDEKTGTLRVWLFREVANKPKERVVDDVVRDFERRHRGVRVEVQYIPVDSRAEKVKGAFNDPASAPDLMEFGNTDTAGYVVNGGLADVEREFADWDAAEDIDPTAERGVTVGGKRYGVPLFVGARALYYRTDVFEELGLEPPRTLAELTSTARKIRAERPELYGLATGGAYTYAALPFLWAHGGELARATGKSDGEGGSGEAVRYTARVDSPAAKKGIAAYARLLSEDICPPGNCAQMTGNEAVDAFAGGKAGMVIGGDFNRQAVDAGKSKGKYGVVPLPGVKKGTIAPAFAGGNNIGILRSSSHRTLAGELMKELAGKKAQKRFFQGMGFLPTYTDTRAEVAKEEPFVRPFVETLDAGAEFVPVAPGWAEIDAGRILPVMFQRVAQGQTDVDGAAAEADEMMEEVFSR
ncbi:extracellular solute-binding protein [Streptomyces sp. HNM0574]|uniref:extracellular solute-binding protein n=1 Tax=Streptomyces sp. HNM0574 TaxID=2714954 RepID=UPI00146B573C|nr:extracellular solute-binding protein [Streptomyces sp. HNM0574]